MNPNQPNILCAVVMLVSTTVVQQTAGQEKLTLKPAPKTVAWGYYDAKAAPVLRVKSGDTVEIQTPSALKSAQEAKRPIIYVKHLVPPLHYPPLGRQARLQGTILMKLKIAADGAVLSIESSPGDSGTVGFGLLRDDAEKLVKKWTFGCVGCPPDVPFGHAMKFRYTLDDDVSIQESTTVVMNLPDEITITSDSFPCDHCPSPKASKKGSH
jgi:hypothetical protein